MRMGARNARNEVRVRLYEPGKRLSKRARGRERSRHLQIRCCRTRATLSVRAVDRIPSALFRVFFHDAAGRWLRWHTEKLWALPTAAAQTAAGSLWWHLELPVWPSATQTFDLRPSEVLAAPALYPDHWQRVLSADLSSPLDLFENFGRWVIMDGYHRLARHSLEGSIMIPVRHHERALLATILAER